MTRLTAILMVSTVFVVGARAETINLATGLDSSGSLWSSGNKLDANWTITSNTNGDPTGPNAYTVFSNNVDWYGGWKANGPFSDWIAVDPNITTNGDLYATRTFTLTAAEVATASFSHTVFTLDDVGEVDLNGHVEATLGDGNWGSLNPVTLNTADLVAGVNTLVVQVTSTDNFLEGVRFAGELTYTPSGTPEPVTSAIGLAGVGMYLRRRSKRAKA